MCICPSRTSRESIKGVQVQGQSKKPESEQKCVLHLARMREKKKTEYDKRGKKLEGSIKAI